MEEGTMLTHKGTKLLENHRLILRQVTHLDAEPMLRNWASDPEVTRFLTWPPHSCIEVTQSVIRSWIKSYEQNDYYQWTIVLKDLGEEPIGSISVVSHNDLVQKAEIGYCIGRKWWHQGIMTEALNEVIRYLFMEVGMKRIEAKHDTRNPHSGAVMRKCGMRFEGTTLGSDRNNLGICDMDHYALLRKDYEGPLHFMEDYSPNSDEELVQEIYRRSGEEYRLNRSKSARVEFLTTVSYIEKNLSSGMKILDVGAGAGEYSLFFSRKGFDISAIELSDANIAAFRRKLTASDSVNLVQGNAMDLSMYDDDSFDIVLLMGPLYHLHSEEDKLRCIAEAKRVCRPGGKIFIAFIENDMVILTMQQAHYDYLLKGDYDKETFQLHDFPFVFHTLPHARALMGQSNLQILHEVASDGLSELLGWMIDRMDDKTYQQYLRYHAYICEKPECVGMSNHLLFVTQK